MISEITQSATRSERKFDGIGVAGKISSDQEQDDNSYLLVDFKEREKHSNVPKKTKRTASSLVCR